MTDLNSEVLDSMIMTRVLSALPKNFNYLHEFSKARVKEVMPSKFPSP